MMYIDNVNDNLETPYCNGHSCILIYIEKQDAAKKIANNNIPWEEIDQNVKTGIPPPSPASFWSPEKLENCTSALLLGPLRKLLMDLLVLTIWVTVATCR